MRKLFGGMVLAALALLVTTKAQAQRRTTSAAAGGAKHEFGIDLGAAYTKPSGVSGGIQILSPLDIRLGIVSRGELMWEPHVSLSLSSVGGTTIYTFTPGVNVLYSTKPGGHRRGMFFTGGAGLVLADLGVASGASIQLNGGVGWRKPYGSGAWRYGLGFRWISSSDVTPSTIQIGGRVGISLWH